MKILVLNWQDIKNPMSGGAEVHLHEIFKRVARRGHEVTLYCTHFMGAAREETIDGIRIIREGSRNLFNYLVPYRYLRTFRRHPYDVVVDDLNKIPFFTPAFVRKPLVGIIHHFFGKSIFSEAALPAALYVAVGEQLAKVFYRSIPLGVVSESTKNELLERGFQDQNIRIVRNCVDRSLYKPGATRERYVAGYLGRLKKYKSVEDLLLAFQIVLKEIPESRLMIVGEGNAKPYLERVAMDVGVAEKVKFLGQVSETEKVQYLGQMRFAVNTSAKEGWGLTVIEANACGVPVIASNVPGLRDSVLDQSSGLLYEYGNIQELSRKMLLLFRDDELCNRLSNGALEWARTFDWEQSADSIVDLLTHTIATRSHTS